MMGESGISGMYTLAANDIYHYIQTEFPDMEVYVAFYEIYCEKLYDLLNNREQVHAREDAKQNV